MKHLSIKFNKKYFSVFSILLLIETGIAVFLKDGFIRYTFGDFLASILLYCLIYSFINAKPFPIAITTLILAFGIEFLQLFNVLDWLHLRHNKPIAIILGSHFSVQDLVAYTLGIITVLILEYKFATS